MNKDEVILVTGAAGMVGKNLCESLIDNGYKHVIGISRREADLRDYSATAKVFSEIKPNYVFMVAAKVGGIPVTFQHPAEYLTDNLSIEFNLFELSRRYKVNKNLFIGSSSLYPLDGSNPKTEAMLLRGLLDDSIEGYVLAKIVGIKIADLYFRQYGMLTICPMVANVFGSYASFNLKTAHVIPSLIKQLCDAHENDYRDI